MKKTSVLIVTLLLVSTAIVGLSMLPDRARAATLYVGGSGPGNYTTIQSAIDSAFDGDTIYVYNGTYNERVVINKTVSLVGEDRNATVVDGGGIGSVVRVLADWVNITELTMTNSGSGSDHAGVRFVTVSNCSIVKSRISGTKHGIYLYYSSFIMIANNSIRSNMAHGVQVWYSSNTTTIYNTLYSNFWDGLHLFYSENNTVARNNATGNAAGLALFQSPRNVISNNQVWDSLAGIRVSDESDSNTIVNNTVGNSQWHGIMIEYSRKNFVSNNTANSNELSGIDLFRANNNNTIANNTAYSNKRYGIGVRVSNRNHVIGNAFSDNSEGIHLESANYTRIANNSVSGNGYGIHIDSSHSGKVFHNDVIGNTAQAFDNTNLNEWDDGYPSGGNHWSDYSGIDQFSGPLQDLPGSDGIGDTPYVIDADSQDNYPFMEPRITTLPSAPVNLQAFPGNSHVNITWSPPLSDGGSIVTNYEVYRGTTPGGEAFLTEVGNVLHFNDTSVTNEITYFYQVSAKNVIGEGPLSNEASATPLGSPSEPLNLQASAGDSYVNLTWSPPTSDGGSPVINFRVHRGTMPDGETYLVEIGNVSYYNDTSVTNGITYFYKVSARNAFGEGPLSNEASATPLGPPSAPLNLQASAGDSYVNLTWSPPISDGGSPIVRYDVYRGTTPGGETFLVEIGTVLRFNDTTVTNGINYYYQVSARNMAGEGPKSNETSAFPTPPPARPSILYVNLTGSGFENVTLIWSLSMDDGMGFESVVSYRIYRNTTYNSEGLGYSLIASLPNGTSEFTDSYTGEGDSSDYFYRLCAIDQNSNSGCADNQAAKFTRTLAQGLNLVSIPVVQSDESIGRVLQAVDWDKAWSYDSSFREWRTYMKDKTYKGELLNVDHTMALWVNVTEDSNLTVAGIVPAQTTMHLHKGWNLVSFPSFLSYSVSDLKAVAPVERVEAFDSSASPHFLRVLLDSDILLAGQGYWVKTSEDATWVVSNV